MFFTPRKQIRLPPDEYLGAAISLSRFVAKADELFFKTRAAARLQSRR